MTDEEAIHNLYALKLRTKILSDKKALEMAIKALEQARPKGKWIDDSKEDSYYANCSHCNYQIDTHYERGYLNYCPNCGAKMQEVEE